jgi:transposase
MKQKKQWTNKEKFVIALAAVRNEMTIQELCAQHHVAPSQVYAWKKELLEHGSEIFDKPGKANVKSDDSKRIERLYVKIGQLTVEKDFLQRALGKSQESDDLL